LLGSIADPKNVEKRSQVMLGSLQAGLAFSNASLGGVHAMAHSLGGWLDLPHGECNAMLVDHVIAFNFPEAGERYRSVGEALGVNLSRATNQEARNTVLSRVRDLRKNAGILQTLSGRGVHRTEVKDLADGAMRDPCMLTNPRRPKQRDIEVIYEESL
jgi:alcohol dehydrogenase class IV